MREIFSMMPRDNVIFNCEKGTIMRKAFFNHLLVESDFNLARRVLKIKEPLRPFHRELTYLQKLHKDFGGCGMEISDWVFEYFSLCF